MTGRPRAIRFLHIADLHLQPCPRGGECSETQLPCHVCIKWRILARLAQRLLDPEQRPDLLLLAGDLTEARRSSHRELARMVQPLEQLVRTAQRAGVVVAGVTGEHDGEGATVRFRDELGWNWLLKTGEVNREAGVAIHGVAGRPRNARAEESLRALQPQSGEQSIVVVHGEASTLLRTETPARFAYYALGHRHAGRIFRVEPGGAALAAYPGHLFSYWDGDGKAWPVHAVEGFVEPRGVSARLVSLSAIAGAPETRRVWASFADGDRSTGTLVIENAPDQAFFDRLGMGGHVDSAPEKHAGRRVAHVRYDSRAALRSLLVRLAESLPSDVFVSPARAIRSDRFVCWGHAVAPRTEELESKIFKRSAVAQ